MWCIQSADFGQIPNIKMYNHKKRLDIYLKWMKMKYDGSLPVHKHHDATKTHHIFT